MDSYEKIAIFCILGLLLIGIFTILFYMWRNQRETYRTIKKIAERINAIQIEIAARPPLSRTTSMRHAPTAPAIYMPHPAQGPFHTTQQGPGTGGPGTGGPGTGGPGTRGPGTGGPALRRVGGGFLIELYYGRLVMVETCPSVVVCLY